MGATLSAAKKRWGQASLFATAGLLATLLVPSPATASYYEHGVSLTGKIVRDSVSYELNIKAVTAMGGPRLDVTISALQDPAGATRVRQIQRWSFPLTSTEFSMQDGTVRVEAGSEGSSFHGDFLVERRSDARCSDSEQLFVTVPEGGGFNIETGNEVFGTITELPACGEPWWFSSGPLPGRPCPIRGHELWAQSLHLKERRSSDVARIAAHRSEQLDLADRSGTWSFELKGTVPASRFRLDRQLTGSFEGNELPWLDGIARFEPKTAFEPGSWYDCRGKREARTAYREGRISGNLTLEVIGSQPQTVSDAGAVATRSRVRSR